MIRSLIVLCIAAFACACTSMDRDAKAVAREAPLPTEQFAITVTPTPDEILLAPHQDGLSNAQADALAGLVARWREAGGQLITIRAPSGGQGQAYRSTAAIEDALQNEGVRADQIRVGGYDAGSRAGAPIAVGFTRYQAQGPECGHDWKNFTASGANQVNSNFGCASTANIAAMIANPADLLAPRPMDPSDAGRRETVLGKYRQGQITSSAKDTQATGVVSNSVQQ